MAVGNVGVATDVTMIGPDEAGPIESVAGWPFAGGATSARSAPGARWGAAFSAGLDVGSLIFVNLRQLVFQIVDDRMCLHENEESPTQKQANQQIAPERPESQPKALDDDVPA